MIQVVDLVKNYGPFKAVQGVTFSVKAGEILGFLGPNGAGKSTVMRILTCFLPATSGRVMVAGFDCETDPLEVRRRIGYLPENNPLYLDMRVTEYLGFVAHAKGLNGDARRSAVGLAMEECGVAQVGGKLIAQLSKGYRQRVGLAQALLGEPDVLILDEPTVGLDPGQIAEIRHLIKSLAGKRTVILSTHILPEVSMVCDRVVIINQGRVVEQDSTANLSRKMQQSERLQVQIAGPLEAVSAFLGHMDKVQAVHIKERLSESRAIYEIETAKDSDLRAAVAAAVVQKGWGLEELRFVGLALEDIFLKLVTQDSQHAQELAQGAVDAAQEAQA